MPATVRPLAGGQAEVQFAALLRDITPRQGAVFDQGERCLGGGLIEPSWVLFCTITVFVAYPLPHSRVYACVDWPLPVETVGASFYGA